MPFERFPVKEKLATNLDAQLAWLVREMGYSRDKTKGYEEKVIRLGRGPGDPRSVFGFMNNYWHRFVIEKSGVEEMRVPLAVSRALQVNGKIVAGLCDKVALALWLQSQVEGSSPDSEWLLDTALDAVRERVNQLGGTYSDDELLAFTDRPFQENPMGQAVLALHQSFARDPRDAESLHSIALEGSAAGILIWQAYARNIESQGFGAEMPMPGLQSGDIKTWD